MNQPCQRPKLWLSIYGKHIRRVSSNFDVIIIIIITTDLFKFQRKNIAFRRNSTDDNGIYQFRPSVLIFSSNFIALSRSPSMRSCCSSVLLAGSTYCGNASEALRSSKHSPTCQKMILRFSSIYTFLGMFEHSKHFLLSLVRGYALSWTSAHKKQALKCLFRQFRVFYHWHQV